MSANIPFRYIDQKAICSIFNVSRATLERQISEGRFPKPYKLGKRTVRWRSDELEAYINNLPRMDNAYSRHGRGNAS